MTTSSLQSFSEYHDFVKKQMRAHRLHTFAQNRLKFLLSRINPNANAVSEVSAVLGGRNDLIQFSFNERRVVFEFFFSPSQVPQDLRLLEQSNADVKVAILLDQQINPKLAEEYHRKKPESFPYLWLRVLIMPQYERLCLTYLQELTDENSPIRRLRRILTMATDVGFHEQLNRKLTQIEEAMLARPNKANIDLDSITIKGIATMQIIAQIRALGIPVDRLRPLYAWLQESISFAFELVVFGMQAFLITDLGTEHAIWSAGDLADDLILGGMESKMPCIVMPLNKVINDLYEKVGFEKRPLKWNFFHTYAELIGRYEPIWVTHPEIVKSSETDHDAENKS